jgi:hypothetical protein
MKTIMVVSFCMGLALVQGSLISYNLNLLNNTTDGAPFNTTLTYPDVTTSGFVVMDPSDNVGRMDRMSVFSFNASSSKVQAQSGSLNLKSYGLGFTGSEVLSTTLYSYGSCIWNNTAGTFFIPADTVIWIGREIADENSNGTVFNDIAYGFKLTNNGAAGRDAGDIIELVGIVYSTGKDSVFGKTADELTTVLNLPFDSVLVATARDASVKLDWHDSFSPSFASYTVYRSEESGSNYVSVASGLSQSAYTNSGLVNGSTYYFLVTETSVAGESSDGREVSATPFCFYSSSFTFPTLSTNYPLYAQLYSDVQIGNSIAAGAGGGKEGAETLSAAYAYLHPQSPHRYDPDYLARLKVLLDANFHSTSGNALSGIAYCFQSAYAYMLLKHHRPADLTAAEIADWEAALVRFCDYNLSQNTLLYDDHILANLWLNGDIRIAKAIYFAGIALSNTTYQAKAQQAIDLVMTQAVAGDGATHYVGFNNEVSTYRDVSINSMLWWWVITGSPEMKAALDQTIPYVPLSVEPSGFQEQSTAISYKHMYNGLRGRQAALATAYLYGDRYNYYFGQDVESRLDADYAVLLASLYRGSMAPLTPPTDFILYDRAIMGPRGRWADWAFVATGRNPQTAGPEHDDQGYAGHHGGKNTFIGAMALGSWANNTSLKAALDGVCPEFKNKAGVTGDWARSTDGVYRFLSQDENTSTITRDTFATLATDYRLSERVSSPATPEWGAGTDWFGEQAWLMTEDRVVGLVQIHSEAAADIYGINIRIVLSGGRVPIIGAYHDVVEVASNEYDFGELSLRIGENNFGGIQTVQRVGMQNGAGDEYGAILRLHDSADRADDTLINYPAGTRRWAVVECIRNGRSFASYVNNVTEGDHNVAVLEVREADRRFRLIQNLTASARTCTGDFWGVSGAAATLHKSWTNTVDVVTPVPGNAIAINVDLPPYGHVVVVSGSDSEYHSSNQNHYEDVFPEDDPASRTIQQPMFSIVGTNPRRKNPE